MMHSTRLDRARGCLLGLAIGDALGAPLEGLSALQIRQTYGVVSDFVDGVAAWRKRPIRWRLRGLYSDDTQQALVLSQCLIERGRIDLDWIAATYLAMVAPRGGYLGAHRNAGASFRLMLEALESGVDPRESGQDSAGCGAAVRVAPLALFHHNDADLMLREVLAASFMSHRDLRSLAAAAAMALAVWHLARGAARTPSFLLRLAAGVRKAEEQILEQLPHAALRNIEHRHAISVSIAHVESLLDRPRDQAYAAIMGEANRHGPVNDCRRPTVGFPPACLAACFYAFHTTESLEEALIEVINLGGDADAAGAMLGALAGAHYGATAIPDRWLAGLRNRDGVSARADLLVAPDAEVAAKLPPLVETELQLTRDELGMRESCPASRRRGDDINVNRRWEI